MSSERYKLFNMCKISSAIEEHQLGPNRISGSMFRGLRYMTNEGNETNNKMDHEMDYEYEWINKLAVIDDEHSRMNGLSERNIDRLLQSLTSKYVRMRPERYCSSQSNRNKQSDGLRCANDVEKYKSCVDESLRDAVRKDGKYERRKRRKKESFTEAFERKYGISLFTKSNE